MASEKAASDIELKISVQGTMIRKISLVSYVTRGDYNLKPLAYGINHRGVRLVEIDETPSDKYMCKYIFHRTGLINL